jgi:carboxypeptidase Taq
MRRTFMKESVKKLNMHLERIIDLRMASSVLQWDEETYMPEKGLSARGEQIASLSSLAHELFISDETLKILSEAEAATASEAYVSDEASLVRVTRRDYDTSAKIPSDIIAEQSRLASHSFAAWREARQKQSFDIFAPFLTKTIELNRTIADLLGYTEHPYDALLNIYEPGMKTSDTVALFEKLKTGLLPLVKKYTGKKEDSPAPFLKPEYDINAQWNFSIDILKAIGFDFTRGRQDKSAHPFSTNFSPNDVRVTNRFTATNPLSSIFSAIHEGGHALYEMGVNLEFERTNLAGGASLGLHESQSRMWENLVGRSSQFWNFFFSKYAAYFPAQLKNVSEKDFYKAVNAVQPGCIRVDADELTYNLHIFIRFELECALFSGKLQSKDIPSAWNEKYRAYLGIDPQNDSEGCLQDIHWAHGSFGYFPTYTFGNIIAAQLFQKAEADMPALHEQFAHGDFSKMLEWLRSNVHHHGRKFTSKEIVKKVTGDEINPDAFIRYLQKKY